jgi:hypothetical protein
MSSYKNQLSSYVRDFCAGVQMNLKDMGVVEAMLGGTFLIYIENQ